jgi:LuxR family quorum sensing-dependent transcriptional regulator
MASSRFRTLAFDAIEQLASASSMQQLMATLFPIVDQFGLSNILIVRLPPQSDGAKSRLLYQRMPAGWHELYERENFYAVDHIAAHARKAVEAFDKTELPVPSDPRSGPVRLVNAQAEFGISKGLVVPFGQVTNTARVISLSGRQPDLQPGARRALELIALYTGTKASALLEREQPAYRDLLSAREREVLKWIAAGKTSWEVSRLFGTSERSINNVIAGAMVKLGAVTRTQAVVNAIRVGEIGL